MGLDVRLAMTTLTAVAAWKVSTSSALLPAAPDVSLTSLTAYLATMSPASNVSSDSTWTATLNASLAGKPCMPARSAIPASTATIASRATT